ncbi:energy-coupling factor transporter transmembrane protein EcfT [Rhodococcus sp. BP-241]|uniref:energy-coupling factor transporter transmembrane component T family protein n=1 Tax=Rhodococcus sp. BP-241 TaxID=2739441 RepID=UPI001C9A8E56|nr:energy-coupling factor transporter transmembrane protein EcfT [Rhodococcus sp. BP-241]MBY6709395.1 energy-coupling factor transporter transmembrane protein EcfT [Rhodococcus sp. BP-241]
MRGTLLRELPRETSVHRLWAGTKLVAVTLLGGSLVVYPTWPMLAAVSVVLLLAAIAARVPVFAIPVPPWWLWGLVAFGAAVNVVVGVDAVWIYFRGILFGVVLLWATLTVAWTTSMADIAPAIATLLSPLRRVGAPVTEWAVSMALLLRSLPMLVDDVYTLVAARKLRPRKSTRSGKTQDTFLIDIMAAIMSVAIRRSADMGEAIAVRGGSGSITSGRRRPHGSDAVALVLVIAACATGVVLS